MKRCVEQEERQNGGSGEAKIKSLKWTHKVDPGVVRGEGPAAAGGNQTQAKTEGKLENDGFSRSTNR